MELVTVHPVDPDPPPKSTSPVDPWAIRTLPVVPASRVMFVAAVETDIVGAVEVNVMAVLDVVIVSIDATPVSAPPVVTFKPPDEVRAKVPVELPMATAPVLVVANFKAPVPFGIIDKASSEIVPIVAAEPLPRLSVVLVISLPVMVISPLNARVAAVVNVARDEAVIVSAPSVISPVVFPILTAPVVVVFRLSAPVPFPVTVSGILVSVPIAASVTVAVVAEGVSPNPLTIVPAG